MATFLGFGGNAARQRYEDRILASTVQKNRYSAPHCSAVTSKCGSVLTGGTPRQSRGNASAGACQHCQLFIPLPAGLGGEMTGHQGPACGPTSPGLPGRVSLRPTTPQVDWKAHCEYFSSSEPWWCCSQLQSLGDSAAGPCRCSGGLQKMMVRLDDVIFWKSSCAAVWWLRP